MIEAPTQIETAKSTYSDEPMAIATIEQCICLQCDGTIRPEHILRRSLHGTGQFFHGTRIEAYCESCDAAYTAVRSLTAGGWVTVGQVTRVTSPTDLARIKAAADEKAGTIQLRDQEALLAAGIAARKAASRTSPASRDQASELRRLKQAALPAAATATAAAAVSPRSADPFEDPDAQPDPARLAAEIDLHRRERYGVDLGCEIT